MAVTQCNKTKPQTIISKRKCSEKASDYITYTCTIMVSDFLVISTVLPLRKWHFLSHKTNLFVFLLGHYLVFIKPVSGPHPTHKSKLEKV